MMACTDLAVALCRLSGVMFEELLAIRQIPGLLFLLDVEVSLMISGH